MISNSKVQKYYLIILIALTALQYSSIGADINTYQTLRTYIALVIGLGVIIHLKNIINSIFNEPIFSLHFLSAFICVTLLIIILIIDKDTTITPLLDLVMCLVFILLGYSMRLSDEHLYSALNFFVFVFTLAALSIILEYSTGFEIPERYLPIPKNQFAPVFAMAFILSIYNRSRGTKPIKILLGMCTIILFFSLLVIRSRSSILAIILLVIIYTIYHIPTIKYKISALFAIFLTAVIASPKIYQALFSNYDINSLESVSAGRVGTYGKGIFFLMDSPLGGTLQSPYISDSNIHNYLLYNLVNYGLFLSIPLTAMYFFYLFLTLALLRKNTFRVYEFAPLLILIIFVSSVFEYSFPFAPGSAVLFPMLFLGIHLNRKRQNKV